MSLSRKLCVIGSGTMGHGIAQVSAMAGYHVTMVDVSQEILSRALERVKWSLGKLAEKGRIRPEQVQEVLSRMATTTSIEEGVSGASIVIEAVVEDADVKKQVFRRVSSAASDDALIATNTSTIPISELAEAVRLPERFIGLHFFNPPQLMPLVEVVLGRSTSEATLKRALEYVRSIGKEHVVCTKDVPGFIVNRILAPIFNTAAWLVSRGEASVVQIDSAAKYQLGLPMGPFELADYSGVDVSYRVIEEIAKREENPAPIAPLLRELYEKKWYGQKAGRGFYEYKGAFYERPQIPPEAGRGFDVIRLLAPAVNAAAWLLERGVASREDIDKAVKLGLGFPRGILEYADELGIDKVVEELERLAGLLGPQWAPVPLLLGMVREGRKGKASGRGFYEYAKEEKRYSEIALRREPPLAWISLNRPQRLNALTPTMLEELGSALDELEGDASIRVVIIRGEGGRAFSAGADISFFQPLPPHKVVELMQVFHDTYSRLERFPKPIIAAIDGYCLGGGMEMAAACDFRLASERSELGQPELNLGIMPGAGGTQRWTRLVGLARAKELVMLGQRIRAQEALSMGLVHRVYPNDRFEEEVRSFALKLAELPPIALAMAKLSLNFGADMDLRSGLLLESALFSLLFGTKDMLEGISAFLGRRRPEFKGE